MLITFTKYHASGNDFLIIDDRDLQFQVDSLSISQLCHRRFGIGADGLLLIQPSKLADIKMALFNPDGSKVSQCGNALRCLTDFIYQQTQSKKNITIELGTRIIDCFWQNDLIGIDLGTYVWTKQNITIDSLSFDLIDIGVPHAVCCIEDFTDIIKAPQLRSHPAFGPQGANINFVKIDKNHLFLKTFERSVEEEVFSCVSGAAASSIIAKHRYKLKNPIHITPKSHIPFTMEVFSHNVRSFGKASRIFDGQVILSKKRPPFPS